MIGSDMCASNKSLLRWVSAAQWRPVVNMVVDGQPGSIEAGGLQVRLTAL